MSIFISRYLCQIQGKHFERLVFAWFMGMGLLDIGTVLRYHSAKHLHGVVRRCALT